MDEQIYLNLKNCLNPDNKIRKSSENFIENAKIFKLTELLNTLFLIFSSSSNNIDNNTRNIASVLYKNILSEENIWINLSSSLKNKIREDLYNLLETSNEENKIKNACVILANILFKECENNDIKNLKLIIKKLQNEEYKKNNKIMISYLFTIKTFFDKFEEKRLLAIDIINSLQTIIIPLIKNYKNENGNILEEKKLELALDIYILIIPFMKFSFNLDPDYVFKPVLDLMEKLNWESNIYMKNLLVINEAINYYHRYIINHIKIICAKLFEILNKIVEKNNKGNSTNGNIIINNSEQNISNIVLFYLDIICLLCDKELADKTSLTTMFQNNSSEIYLPLLVSLLDKFPEFNIENESWNISKAVCYIISFIVSISSQDEILFKLLNYFSSNFNSISYNKKINAILILSCILDSKDAEIIQDSLQNEILNIIQKIDDEDKIYSYLISWILGKISEALPSLFERDELNKIIPKFINIINNKGEKDDKNKNTKNEIVTINYSNEVRINICIVLGNLIKFYGDENTNKLNNEFNMYYKYIINDFIEASFKEENIISGLSFYLLRVIMNVIQYSSKDLQASLEFIFSNILQKFEEINTLLKNNKNKIQKIYLEKLYKLQENLCLILNQIFNKIILKINISLCIQLYNSLINSFLNRENKAFESGMLCLLNLVILLFNENVLMNNKLDVEIFYKLISAILINEEDGDDLKKIGILCLLNLVKINSYTLSKYINELYDILKNIKNKNKIGEEFKKLVDKSIEDIEQSQIYKNKNKI